MTIPTPLTPPELPDDRAAEMARLGAATGSRRTATTGHTAELAGLIFEGPERWGWEFAEPAPVAEYPHWNEYPQWIEPPPPDLTGQQMRLARARHRLARRISTALVLVMVGVVAIGLSLRSSGGMVFGILSLLAGVGIGAWAVCAVTAPSNRMREMQARAASARDAVYADYRQVCELWDERRARHDAAEQLRFANDPLLFPLAPRAGVRVDVVGGTADGWAALITTMGSSVLACGGAVLVLDLSGQGVTAPLLELGAAVGGRATTATVPADLDRPWLLGALGPRELADVLAAAMDAQRGPGGAADLGAMDVELIQTVARRLDAPVTFARLAAGVRVLRSTYEDDDTLLSAAERLALTDRVDVIGRSERMRDELGFVQAQLEMLAESQPLARMAAPGSPEPVWPESGLCVVRSVEDVPRRKTFVDRVLFETITHHLSTAQPTSADPVLVVAGADELGRTALESAARKASRAGVRLVYLFEHLRDDAEQLLGGGGSVAVLMRLGNPREAATAAEFVGRGFTFQLSQLSRQHGRNETTGQNSSVTDTTGGSESVTNGRSRTVGRGASRGGSSGPGGGRNWSKNWSESVTDSSSQTVTDTWSTSRQSGESFSQGWSDTDGVVLQRSYDFTVEPTQIQTLEPTTFLIVDSGPQGRRVRMADCFPGSVYVPRRSPAPR